MLLSLKLFTSLFSKTLLEALQLEHPLGHYRGPCIASTLRPLEAMISRPSEVSPFTTRQTKA
jgi:hypothetical protein